MMKPQDNNHLNEFQDKYGTIQSKYGQSTEFYADPSNMFAKSWGYSLLRYDPEFSDQLAIIYAHRNLHDLARSYFEWGYVPGK